ncbi:MAG: glycosyltransferase family 4 protein [Caldilineaceae bacterium]|jgi:glycosyltransferase involved in cell wall biosynthesis
MRIGIDARLTYHQPAGISRYTWYLLRALAQLNQHDDFVVFQHRKHREPLIDQKNFHRSTLYAPVHHRIEQFLLPVELFWQSLDLIHSTDFIAPLYSPVPAVVTVHDLAFFHWPNFLTKDSAAYYGQIDRAVRHARHVIVPSESTKHDLIGILGTPEKKISVIYEAANPSFAPMAIEPARRAMSAKFKIPSKYILFVSTIEPRKNVDGLLHAYHYLREKYNPGEVALVLAGSHGWLYEETLALVKKLKLQEHTFFLGRVSDEDLHQLYVGARCHVHPAHYEGFGLPPLEAMACGTPTIVSNTSSLPEVVGDASLLVNPADQEEIAVAMHRLLTDDALHAELCEKGLKRAKCFSWETAARSTLDVYRKAISMPAAVHALPSAPPNQSSNKQTTLSSE